MEFFLVAGLAAAAAFAGAALKKYNPEISAVLSVAAGTLILISVLSRASPLIREISELCADAGLDTIYGAVLLKTIGICCLCQFTADTCRDAGQASLASKVEFAGRVTIILTALPVFQSILGTASALLGGGFGR